MLPGWTQETLRDRERELNRRAETRRRERTWDAEGRGKQVSPPRRPKPRP